MNDRWCHPNNVTVKSRTCSPTLETLVVNLRPYYLPREFSQVIITTVYIPPSANAKTAADELCCIIHDIDTAAPDALHIVNGDFNHCSLNKTSTSYEQHVSCFTRNDRTIDLCYTNVQAAYTSEQLPPLGKSDHNLVHLLPKYRPVVQRQPVKNITVKHWSPESIESLKASLECTNWNVFIDSSTTIDNLVETVGDYINFCVDSVVPNKTVKIFPNNKPWISKEVKALVNKKRLLHAQSCPYELFFPF